MKICNVGEKLQLSPEKNSSDLDVLDDLFLQSWAKLKISPTMKRLH